MHENTPHMVRLSPISPKECNKSIPVLWYWILMELQTVLGYKIEVNENTNYLQRIAVTFLIFNRIIFHLVDGFRFQPHHPPFILTIHMVLFINCSLSTLWLKLHHGRFHFFVSVSLNIWFKRGSSCVICLHSDLNN